MCSLIADHQLEKNDLNLMAERPISETKLLSTQDSDLPLVQVSDPSLQCLREDGFSTFKDQAKGVDAPESSKTRKTILVFIIVVKHLIL